MFELDLLGLLFDRHRLRLVYLLFFLKCPGCLPLLFISCLAFFMSENEPALWAGYGVPNLPLLLLSEPIIS